MIKKEIRVLGIAWTTQLRRSIAPTQVVGVVYRGNRWLEGVMRAAVPSDVVDLTDAIAKMIIDSPHFPQLRVIALDQLVAKSGNHVDAEALSGRTKLPVVAVLQQKELIKRTPKAGVSVPRGTMRALSRLSSTKWKAGAKRFFVYSAGLGRTNLGDILAVCASKEGPPEAARVARTIVSSLERLFGGRPKR